MSQTQTPITTVFDVQRNAVRQSRDAVHQMIDFQTQSSETVLKAMRTAGDASGQTADVTKAAVDAYFDALEAGVPGDAEGLAQLRGSVHEQIDAGRDVQAETWEAIEALAERNVEAATEFADDYAEVVDDSFDAFLEAHERVEEGTVNAAESVEVPIDAAE